MTSRVGLFLGSHKLQAAAAAAGVVLLAITAWRLRRPGKTRGGKERSRRDHLNGCGRVVEGTVTEVSEMVDEKGKQRREMQLLIYQYDVRGVHYEASQDVTEVRHLVDLHSCRIGVPASVKYDPQSPGNSMVVSETWSGLHG